MSEQLYRYVEVKDRKPSQEQEVFWDGGEAPPSWGRFRTIGKFDYVVTLDSSGEEDLNSIGDYVAWFEPYTPSPISGHPHEQILQLLITGGFLDPRKLKEARDIIGKCAPSGSLETEAGKYATSKIYPDENRMGFARIEIHEKIKAAFLAGASHSFNKESFLKALREGNPYRGNDRNSYELAKSVAWGNCCECARELLNQKEEK